MCSVEARVPLLNDERVCSGQAEATCIAIGTAQRNATDVDETGRHSRLEFVFRRRPTCDDIDRCIAYHRRARGPDDVFRPRFRPSLSIRFTLSFFPFVVARSRAHVSVTNGILSYSICYILRMAMGG